MARDWERGGAYRALPVGPTAGAIEGQTRLALRLARIADDPNTTIRELRSAVAVARRGGVSPVTIRVALGRRRLGRFRSGRP